MGWMLVSVAQAQGLEWVVESTDLGGPGSAKTACARGTTPIGGSTGLWSNTDSQYLTASGPTADGAWLGRGAAVPGMPVPTAMEVTTGALCAEERLASCLTPVTASIPAQVQDHARLSVTCPIGEFVVGGGGSLTGAPVDVAMQVHGAAGLFAPGSFVIEAIRHVPDGGWGSPPGSWGIEAQAWCAPAEVLDALYPIDTIQTSWSMHGGEVWSYVVDRSWEAQKDWMCPEPVMATAAETGEITLRSHGWFNRHGGAAEQLSWMTVAAILTENTDCYDWVDETPCTQPPAPPPVNRFLCADTLEDYAGALEVCGPSATTRLPDAVLSRFSLGAEVLFGVDDGASGFVWVPGSGPVPVDPQPFREAFAASPIALTTWTDRAARDRRVDELLDALDAERTAYVFATDLRDVADTALPVIVVPRDEEAAVEWIERNRATLGRSRSAAVIVFLEADGRARSTIARW